jgi:hypothetical protein
MNKFAYISWMILFAVLTASCQSPEAKIKPGDKLGDMEFINEYEQCQAPNILNDLCNQTQLDEGTCEVALDKFWVSTGWMEGSQDAMELAWKDSEWSMTFDGHEVDLWSFGTFDMEWTDPTGVVKDLQYARVWNVCVSNPPLGKHTVVYNFLLKNGVWRGNHEVTFNFTVLAAEAP